MNTKAEIENTALDTAKLVIAAALLLAGILAFYHFVAYSLLWRVIGLLAVAGGAAAIALQSAPGRRLWQFGRDSHMEVRKVVWPTRQETVQTLSELSGAERVLIAGHLPSVAEVASFLLTEGSKAAVQFEMGGCCRIDVEELPTHSGRLRWYLTPDQLRLIAS